MSKLNSVCVRCEEAVATSRKDGPVRIAGALVLLLSLFTLWPLAIVGLLLIICGGSRTVCPQCKGPDVVPISSAAAKRILLAAGMAAKGFALLLAIGLGGCESAPTGDWVVQAADYASEGCLVTGETMPLPVALELR